MKHYNPQLFLCTRTDSKDSKYGSITNIYVDEYFINELFMNFLAIMNFLVRLVIFRVKTERYFEYFTGIFWTIDHHAILPCKDWPGQTSCEGALISRRSLKLRRRFSFSSKTDAIFRAIYGTGADSSQVAQLVPGFRLPSYLLICRHFPGGFIRSPKQLRCLYSIIGAQQHLSALVFTSKLVRWGNNVMRVFELLLDYDWA